MWLYLVVSCHIWLPSHEIPKIYADMMCHAISVVYEFPVASPKPLPKGAAPFASFYRAFRRAWVQSSDFEKHPLDPPLSDSGRAEATDVAERIAKFVESKPGSQIQALGGT